MIGWQDVIRQSGVRSSQREFLGRTYGTSNINDDLIPSKTKTEFATVVDLAATYDYGNWEFDMVLNNVFDQAYKVGDAGGACPLPRAGTTVEFAATLKY